MWIKIFKYLHKKFQVDAQRSQFCSAESIERMCPLPLVDHCSSDSFTINTTYRVDLLLCRPISLFFHIDLVNTESESLEWLKRWTLLVTKINIDAYCLLAFSDLPRQLVDTGIGVLWIYCVIWLSEQTWRQQPRSFSFK